ncbi:MAG: RNA polymerase sigma factor [Myxococcota bacterium]
MPTPAPRSQRTQKSPAIPAGSVDEGKLLRAQAGDRAAAGELLEALLPRLRNLIRYLSGADSDLDDMVQLALVAILKGLPTYRGDASLGVWADRIAVREALRYLRRRRGKEAALRSAAEDLPPPTAPSDPAGYAARREAAALLDALPEPQREVVVLHHIAGMSIPEVATALEIPFDTAKSRLRLALAKLRRQLPPPHESVS